MENKIRVLSDYISKNVGGNFNVYYKYIMEKTINIIIKGLSIDYINLNPKKLELDLINIFGSKVDYSINMENLIITVVDISKINYSSFLDSIKKFSNLPSDCDNYFCAFKEYKSICINNKKFTNLELNLEIFNRIRQVDFSKYNKESIKSSACNLLYNTLPSLNWVNSQINYLNSLDGVSKKIVNLYTKTGDKLINLYLRNGNIINEEIFKLFIKNYSDHKKIYVDLMKTEYYDIQIVKSYIKKLIKLLKSIIDNSPIIEKSFYVYRGRTDKVIANSREYITESFISTSLLTRVAIDFSQDNIKNSYGSIIRFKIRGRVLLLTNSKYLKEYEILLPFGYKYILKSKQIGEFVNFYGSKVLVNYLEYS